MVIASGGELEIGVDLAILVRVQAENVLASQQQNTRGSLCPPHTSGDVAARMGDGFGEISLCEVGAPHQVTCPSEETCSNFYQTQKLHGTAIYAYIDPSGTTPGRFSAVSQMGHVWETLPRTYHVIEFP